MEFDKNHISRHVLYIGPECSNPKGGIAQVLYYYHHLIFGDDFQFIANSRTGNKIANAMIFIISIIKMAYMMMFKRSIRLVHIHTASKRSFVRSMMFANMARWFGRKTIMHIHGGGFRDYYLRKPQYVHKRLMRCDAIIALSEKWRAFYADEIGHPNVYVVNNLVPKPELPQNIDEVRSQDVVHLLFLGLINKEKGIFDLVETIGKHKDIYDGKLCLHIGGTGLDDEMKSLISKYGIDSLVKCEGWVGGELKTDLFIKSSVFVLPSYIEALPLSILEAMSYGLCIVASNVGGIPSIVHQDENGCLITAGNQDEINAALERVVFDNMDRARMGEASLQLVKPFFPEEVSDSLKQIYEQLV